MSNPVDRPAGECGVIAIHVVTTTFALSRGLVVVERYVLPEDAIPFITLRLS